MKSSSDLSILMNGDVLLRHILKLKMSYPKGVYKMMPKTLSFGKDGIFGKPEQRITVKMVLGEQTSCVYGVGNDIKFDDALFFSKLPEEKLLITIYSTDKDEKLGYAEVLLTPLVKIP
jgi:hypothetical protein